MYTSSFVIRLRSEETGLRSEDTGLRSEETGLRSEETGLRSELTRCSRPRDFHVELHRVHAKYCVADVCQEVPLGTQDLSVQ